MPSSYLQRMLSNDVEALEPGEVCDALLLTPKGGLVAALRGLAARRPRTSSS